MFDRNYLSEPEPFLGQGWSFPVRINLQGRIPLSAGDRNIEEAIWIILKTNVGERASRPDFGSTLGELAFAPMHTDTLVLLCVAVEDALTQWEPRIVLDEVRADPDPIRGRVNIIINYRIADSYQPRSLVYPFYLQSAEGDLDAAEMDATQGARAELSLDDW